MIQCTSPNESEFHNLDDFCNHLFRKVKFTDFEEEGKTIAKTYKQNEEAVLLLDDNSVISVRVKCHLGSVLLARVSDGHLNVVSWLSIDIKHALQRGFYAALELKN